MVRRPLLTSKIGVKSSALRSINKTKKENAEVKDDTAAQKNIGPSDPEAENGPSRKRSTEKAAEKSNVPQKRCRKVSGSALLEEVQGLHKI